MNYFIKSTWLFGILLTTISCSTPANKQDNFVEENIRFAVRQEKLQVDQIEKSGKILNPRTIAQGKVKYIQMEDWTSGFYPGTM